MRRGSGSSSLGCAYKKGVRVQPWGHSYAIALHRAGGDPRISACVGRVLGPRSLLNTRAEVSLTVLEPGACLQVPALPGAACRGDRGYPASGSVTPTASLLAQRG